MELTTILNQCYRFPGFVYEGARFSPDKKRIEVRVRPRRGADPTCSGCQQRSPGYDHLAVRRFEFIPVWGFLVVFLYRMRRVNCWRCGVLVEEVPWGIGKHQLTKVYMQFLAHWALGTQAVVEGGRGVVSDVLGEGVRLGGVHRAVGASASRAGTHLRDWRG